MDASLELISRLDATDAKVLEALAVSLARCDGPLPGATLDTLLSALRTSLRNAHTSAAALSCCTSLLPQLSVASREDGAAGPLRQSILALTGQGGLFDRLGDSKEKVRELAGRATLAAGRACLAASAAPADHQVAETPSALWDRLVRELGLASRAARVREMTIHYIAQIRTEQPQLPLKPWVVHLVAALEDQDQLVRDAAREAVVSIFASPAVGTAARNDLKVQLAKQQVRKTMADAVLARVFGQSASDGSASSSGADAHDSAARRSSTVVSGQPSVTNGTLGVKPVYAASAEELETTFGKMQPAFAGVESEQNWKLREEHVATIRGFVVGRVHQQYPDAFLHGLKGVLDGLMRALNSLRTTLMSNTCHLLSELAAAMKTSFDPLVETVLPHLLKMSAQTKKLAVTASQHVVEAIIVNCSYRDRIIMHLLGAMGDKTASARQAAVAQTKNLIKAHGDASPDLIESGAGLELLEKIIKAGLGDVNPAVREAARPTFWLVHRIWPQHLERLKATLDSSIRLQLDKAGGGGSAAPSPATKGRTSVRQAISARRSQGFSTSSRSLTDVSKPPVPRPRTVSASLPPRKAASVGPMTTTMTNGAAGMVERRPETLATAGRGAARLSNASVDSGSISDETPPFSPVRRANGHHTSVDDDDDVVDEEVRLQAQQAEQAAAQLLELNAEEDHTATPIRPSKPLTAAAARLKGSAILADSPAATASTQFRRHLLNPGESWWLSQPRNLAPPPLLTGEHLDVVLSRLRSKTAMVSDLLALAGSVRAGSATWQDNDRAEVLFSGLDATLRAGNGTENEDHALFLWQTVLQQDGSLARGYEMAFFDLLFDLQCGAARQAQLKLDALAGLLGMHVDPLYGIRCLRTTVQRILSGGKLEQGRQTAILTLAMRLVGLLFRRIPASEVLEEEVPLTEPLFQQALTSAESAPREAAYVALSLAALVLGNETALFRLLPQLPEDKQALLTYYAAQAREANEAGLDIAL